MKELSIEEKAKAYDEAYKVTENIHRFSSDPAEIKRMEQIFPELKESEDEKIRKELTDYFRWNPDSQLLNEFSNREVFSWLEKQGEKKAVDKVEQKGMNLKEEEMTPFQKEVFYIIDTNIEAEVGLKQECDILLALAHDESMQNPAWSEEDELHIKELESLVKRVWAIGEHENDKDTIHKMSDLSFFLKTLKPQPKQKWNEEDKNMFEWVIGYLENKMLNTPISEERTACKNAITWFKKLEGEQKPNPCDGCVNRKGCINCENEELRELEQKPTDKVEPKFKVGDWIVHDKYGIKDIDKIVKFDNDKVSFESGEWLHIHHLNEDCKLWNIQDAKDGDVLYINNTMSESIMIYKSFNNGVINNYASYNKFGFKGENYLTLNDGYIIPATKEQRDLLFQKMKEAGYEWDADKKELKKNEQNPTWSEGDETTKNNIIHIIRQYDKISKRENQPCWYVGDCLLWMQNIKDRVLPQPKQEWSEEDTNLLDNCISLIEDIPCTEEEQNWLKSIKDRVLPRQEWSEEDEKKRMLLISILEVNHPNEYFKVNPANTLNMEAMHVEELVDWLKSIKDRVQPKDKLTKLDKNILEAAIAFVEYNTHFKYWRGVDKHTVLSALHSFRSQNR